MNSDRQKILTDYISYLYTTRRTYDTIGKYIKYVTDFLESAEDVNRRSYLAYKRENANIGARYPLMSEAICDLLHHLKIGYNRREQKIKTLERLDAISEKNRKLLNDFIVWLTDNNDYSPHTVDIYYTSLKQYFEYVNEINMENCKRFIRTLEEKSLSPQTIRLRITALEKFSKWQARCKQCPDRRGVQPPTGFSENEIQQGLLLFYQSIGYNGCPSVRIPAVHVGRHYIRGGNTKREG